MCATVCFASLLFFFNDAATTEIYTLSLHDALPISTSTSARAMDRSAPAPTARPAAPTLSAAAASAGRAVGAGRSEEHTSELQSRLHLVCRLLLEKKKNQTIKHHTHTYPAPYTAHSL